MSEKSQALLEAALALDPAERRWLAEALLDSLDDDEEAIRIAGEPKAHAERGECLAGSCQTDRVAPLLTPL